MKKLASNTYFSIYWRSTLRKDGRYHLAIFRRDTGEGVDFFSAPQSSTPDLKIMAQIKLRKIHRPIDWREPSRACIAYYLKMQRKKESLLNERVIKNSFDIHAAYKFELFYESYLFFLLKKLNSLTPTDRKKLLSPTKDELNNPNLTTNVDILYSRKKLYELFFERDPQLSTLHNALTKTIHRLYSEEPN